MAAIDWRRVPMRMHPVVLIDTRPYPPRGHYSQLGEVQSVERIETSRNLIVLLRRLARQSGLTKTQTNFLHETMHLLIGTWGTAEIPPRDWVRIWDLMYLVDGKAGTPPPVMEIPAPELETTISGLLLQAGLSDAERRLVKTNQFLTGPNRAPYIMLMANYHRLSRLSSRYLGRILPTPWPSTQEARCHWN